MRWTWMLWGLLLAACSPVLDWRVVAVEAEQRGLLLQALLPCKPERADRTLVWREASNLRLQVQGCEAGGALYSLSWMPLPPEADLLQMQQQWQQATLAAAGVPNAQAVAREQLQMPQALAQPGVQRMRVQGRDPQGRVLHLQAQWFMRGRDAFMAAIQGPAPIGQEASEAFFAGLQFPR